MRYKSKKWNISQCMNTINLFKSGITWACACDKIFSVFSFLILQAWELQIIGSANGKKMQMVIQKHFLDKEYTVLIWNKTANLYLCKLKLKQKPLMKCDIRLKIKKIMLAPTLLWAAENFWPSADVHSPTVFYLKK